MSEKRFSFDFDGGDTISIDEIWPDGDAPENPTIHDVIKAARDAGMEEILTDWNFGETLTLTIRDLTTGEHQLV